MNSLMKMLLICSYLKLYVGIKISTDKRLLSKKRKLLQSMNHLKLILFVHTILLSSFTYNFTRKLKKDARKNIFTWNISRG